PLPDALPIWLLHVRRGPARATRRRARAAGEAARGAAADLDRPREPRLQGEALRPRGPPAAARAPPRLEGDLLARRARAVDGPAQRVRPGRPLARPLRRDRRRRAPGPAAGRRLRW